MLGLQLHIQGHCDGVPQFRSIPTGSVLVSLELTPAGSLILLSFRSLHVPVSETRTLIGSVESL